MLLDWGIRHEGPKEGREMNFAFDPSAYSKGYIWRGRHLHICDADGWSTRTPDGMVDGVVPDPDYVEPTKLEELQGRVDMYEAERDGMQRELTRARRALRRYLAKNATKAE